jgi:PAS domain S-box-containing protein
MSLDAQSLAFSKLLAQASTQHLRLTLEPLPVGLIEISESGDIESIDEWTAQVLGFTSEQLQGKSISLLFEDCESDILKLLESRCYGSLFQASFRTQEGMHMTAEIVLEPAIQSHKFVCSVIFTTGYVRKEPEHFVLNDNEDLGASVPHLPQMDNHNLSAFEIALLVVLVALMICFFLATKVQFGY